MGQDDGASGIFVVQEATSSRSIESSSAGSIIDHGIKPSSTLYVLWFSNQHVQVNVYCIVFFIFPTSYNIVCEKFLFILN